MPWIRVVGLFGESGLLELRALPNALGGASSSELAVEGREEMDVACDELLPRRLPAAASRSLNLHEFIASRLVEPTRCKAGPADCWIFERVDDGLDPWPDEAVEVEKSDEGFRAPVIQEDVVEVEVTDELDNFRGRVRNGSGGAWSSWSSWVSVDDRCP
jgi:hypothetical protein